MAMLNIEAQMEIKILARQGLSIREICRQMKASRDTVRRILRSEVRAERKRTSQGPQHKLDPYLV